MTNIRTLSAIVIAGAILSASATPLSPAEALQRAMEDTPMMKIPGNPSGFKLVDTRRVGTRDAVFLFSGTSGFVVVPADDAAPALIGYGSQPVADADGKMAPGLEYWLGEMARQVDYIASHSENSVRAYPVKVRPERAPVAPLLSSQWSQGNPYNIFCPKENGENTVTGCVATAMAQTMYYHKWPETGMGSHGYTWNGKTLTCRFSNQQYDWDLMTERYDGTQTKEQQNAVAKLMYACGVSVDMNYSTTGSGAFSINIGNALGSYFRYDKGLQYIRRDNYSLSDWEDLIYNSLKNDGPVIYNGQSYQGGHSFVCDGYDRDGYFHFNWGWAGLSDGYFLLDALDPLAQGTGGSADNSGFNFMQDAIIGIHPDRTGDSVWYETMILNNGFTLSLTEDEEGKTLNYSGLIYNPGPSTLPENIQLGISLGKLGTDGKVQDNTVRDILLSMKGECAVTYGVNQIDFPLPDDLEDGDYLVWTVFVSSDGKKQRILSPIYANSEVKMTVSGEKVEFATVNPVIPEIASIQYPSQIGLSDISFAITGRLVSVSDKDYYSELTPIILDNNDNLVAMGQSAAFDIEAKGEYEVKYASPLLVPRNKTVSPGEYYIVLCTTNGTHYLTLGDPEPVTIVEDASGIEKMPQENFDDMPGVYYNLEGVQIRGKGVTLPKGVYIERRGDKTRKVLVRK